MIVEQGDVETKISKLNHDIEQLDAKIDDKISSLREEFRKQIFSLQFTIIRDTSLLWLGELSSETRIRVHDEINKLINDYIRDFSKVTANELQKRLSNVRGDVNRITRAAGLGEIWDIQKSKG
jgi:hypothetical protein